MQSLAKNFQISINANAAAPAPANLNIQAKSPWVQTYSGTAFYVLAPSPDEIKIGDIAHALSNLCRYGGHCLKFYSVAEHCVLMSDAAPAAYKLPALLHDSSEAYLVDVPTPVKKLIPGYKEIEESLMLKIADKFSFKWPMPAEVKRLDMAIVSDERAQNMKPMAVGQEEWGNLLPPLGVKLKCWSPEEAEWQFMLRFNNLKSRMRIAA